MSILKEIDAAFKVKNIVESSIKEIKTMQGTSSLWSKIVMLIHTVGPQILNLIWMAKGMLPATYGMWISAVLGLGAYVIHVYHDVKSGGVSALATDVSQLSVTATSTAATPAA